MVKPYRKRKTRYARKPKPKSKKAYNGDMLLITKPYLGGFPKSVFTTLKYVENVTLNVAAGGLNSINVFSANSMNDPNTTGVGHQPRGLDQWHQHYDHHYVKRSRIYVNFVSTDATYPVTVGISLRDSITTESNPNDYVEQDCTSTQLSVQAGSKSTAILKKFFDYKRTNNRNYREDDNKASNTGSPAEQQYYHVFAGDMFGNDAGAIKAIVTIFYDACFTELKDLTQS